MKLLCIFLVISLFLISHISANNETSLALVGSNCTEEACNYNGVCTNTGACYCFHGYITYNSDDGGSCNYKQKETFAAFLLEFFLGMEFGAGYWYIGQNGLAAGQLVFFWGSILVYCIIFCIGKNSGKCAAVIAGLFGCLHAIALLGWWIYALVDIAGGTITDGDGASIPSLIF